MTGTFGKPNPANLQLVDRQSDASYSAVAGFGQNFHGAPEESKAPGAGGLAPSLLLLFSGYLQGRLQHQLCQTLSGPRQV